MNKINRLLGVLVVLIGLTAFASIVLADTPPVPAGTTAPVAPAGTDPAPASAAPQQPGIGGMLLPFILMFGVVYLLMIRPQQKKLKEHQQMLNVLKQGDQVVTASGFLGTVEGVAEKIVTLEIAKNVRVKVLKNQVSQVVKDQL